MFNFKNNNYCKKAWNIFVDTVLDLSFIVLVTGPINTFLDIFLNGFDPEYMQTEQGKLLSTVIAAAEYCSMAGLILVLHTASRRYEKAKSARHFLQDQAASAADYAATSVLALISLAGTIALLIELINNKNAIDHPVNISTGLALTLCTVPMGGALVYVVYTSIRHNPPANKQHSKLYLRSRSFMRHVEVASMLIALLEYIERLNPKADPLSFNIFMIAKASLFSVVMSEIFVPNKCELVISNLINKTTKAIRIKPLLNKLNSEMFYTGIFAMAEVGYFVFATPKTLIIRTSAVSAASLTIFTTNVIRHAMCHKQNHDEQQDPEKAPLLQEQSALPDASLIVDSSPLFLKSKEENDEENAPPPAPTLFSHP